MDRPQPIKVVEQLKLVSGRVLDLKSVVDAALNKEMTPPVFPITGI